MSIIICAACNKFIDADGTGNSLDDQFFCDDCFEKWLERPKCASGGAAL